MIIHNVLQDILKYYRWLILNPTGQQDSDSFNVGTQTVKMLIDVNHLQLPGCSDKACCNCILLSIVLIKSGS